MAGEWLGDDVTAMLPPVAALFMLCGRECQANAAQPPGVLSRPEAVLGGRVGSLGILIERRMHGASEYRREGCSQPEPQNSNVHWYIREVSNQSMPLRSLYGNQRT